MEKIKGRSHKNFILNYSFRFRLVFRYIHLIGLRVKNSLDNVNSMNNILWNIEISYNKQNIVFYCISQLYVLSWIIKIIVSF